MLVCDRRGPEACHDAVGDAAQEKFSATAGVFGYRRGKLGVFIVLACPTELTICVDEVSVERISMYCIETLRKIASERRE